MLQLDAAQSASKVAICQRIMDLVDQYHDKPNRHTRGAIRAALMDEWVAQQAATGLTTQLAKAVDAIEAHHDPFCMSVLRGKECDCPRAVQPTAGSVPSDIESVYEKLHAGKLGAHWLWCVIEQVAAGVPEAVAMREYGYYEPCSSVTDDRLRDAAAAVPTQAAQSSAIAVPERLIAAFNKRGFRVPETMEEAIASAANILFEDGIVIAHQARLARRGAKDQQPMSSEGSP